MSLLSLPEVIEQLEDFTESHRPPGKNRSLGDDSQSLNKR